MTMNMETFKEIRPLLDAGSEALTQRGEFQVKIFAIAAELGKCPDFKSETVHGQYMELCDFIRERVKYLKEFAVDCRDNHDCDTGANGSHPPYCRACVAEAIIGKKE